MASAWMGGQRLWTASWPVCPSWRRSPYFRRTCPTRARRSKLVGVRDRSARSREAIMGRIATRRWVLRPPPVAGDLAFSSGNRPAKAPWSARVSTNGPSATGYAVGRPKWLRVGRGILGGQRCVGRGLVGCWGKVALAKVVLPDWRGPVRVSTGYKRAYAQKIRGANLRLRRGSVDLFLFFRGDRLSPW